jgi:hypothetical protein
LNQSSPSHHAIILKIQGLLRAGDGTVLPGTQVEVEGAEIQVRLHEMIGLVLLQILTNVHMQVLKDMELKVFQKLDLKVKGHIHCLRIPCPKLSLM